MDLCKDCDSGCCKSFNIVLLGRDIIKIVETLGVDIGYFVTLFPVSDDVDSSEIPVFAFKDLDGGNTNFRLLLKQGESSINPDVIKCIFLLEMYDDINNTETFNMVSRCGIYGMRPAYCRAFPTKYDAKEGRLLINDQFKRFQNLDKNSNINLCPRPLAKKDYENHAEDYFENDVILNEEKKFFKKVAAKWNESPGTVNEFYDFLVREYKNRLELSV